MTTPEQFQIDHRVHAEVVADFRKRAAMLRFYSVVIIVLIVLVLAAGISIFIFAGQIANTESNPVLQVKRERLSALQDEILSLKTEVGTRKDELRFLDTKYEEEIARKGGTGLGEQRLVQHYATLKERAQQELKVPTERLQVLEYQRQAARDDVFKAEEAASERIGISQNQIPVLVSAFATRVGAVVLLLFLVQILVPLYRYNMKLSSYYDARADALAILCASRAEGVAEDNGADDAHAPVRTSVDTVERLVAALSPDSIDFGKAPATPSEHVVTFAKDVLASQRK
jgi:hypothetical protein